MGRAHFVLPLGFITQVLWAQAPASAELWRLTATTLPGPAALEIGPTGTFWNPAAGTDRVLAVGLQLTETPDVVGVSSVLAGVTYALGNRTRAVLMLGRTDIGDLVRTTTSATSEGEIPVYEQHLALGGIMRMGRFSAGALARAHDARFDADRSTGLTADVGIRWTPFAPLTLAAATHFFPMNLKDRARTDYFAGIECRARSLRIWDTPSRILARYGVSYREGSGLEHGFGLGLAFAERLSADVLLAREVSYGAAEWRPSLGVGLRVGRYALTASRAFGLNGLGATYRIGLDVDVIQ